MTDGKIKKNPVRNSYFSPDIVLQQLGGNRFIAMTEAKNFVAGKNYIGFKIPRAKEGI